MVNLNEFLTTPMGKGIQELSERLQENHLPPVTLNVIGGFALMLHDMRDINSSTDIDYVGQSLGEEFDKIANEVGQKHKLGKGWINNDGMLTGASLDQFELSTGKLHFDHAMTVNNMTINVLCPEDLLRMKIISVDTSIMAVQDKIDIFTRSKDMTDIKTLMAAQDLSVDDVDDLYGDYIQSDQTLPAIQTYLDTNDVNAVLDMLDKQPEQAVEPEPASIDMQAEQKTELGQAILSGGFSIGSILNMAKKREMPSMPSFESKSGSGLDFTD